jgi:type VI secretion system protein ImpA
MATLTVIRGDVLKPISPLHPGGIDLSLTPEWSAIRATRPNLWDAGTRGEWVRAEPNSSSWALLRDLAADALATRSKDIRLAIWLLESSIKLHGFAGMRDGLRVLRELLEQFWDTGLYPLIEDGDLDARAVPLEWLNDKLADAILEIPITFRPAPGANYSAKFFRESRRPNGLITAQEFDAAAAAGSRSDYQALMEDLESARRELLEVERNSVDMFPPDGISVVETKEAMAECRRALEGTGRGKTAAPQDLGSLAKEEVPPEPLTTMALLARSHGDQDTEKSWAAAEQLARGGDIDSALMKMTALANVDANGRVRFQRKLLLAEICLNTKRMRLGRTVLEELAGLIDKHHLDEWEATEMVSAVWTRLYRCYMEDSSGALHDRAAELFGRLCRLNPWQALACGDGK